jgi:hypothetical protein
VRSLLHLFLLAIILKCGVEYKITDEKGAVFFYLIEEALPNGDYVAYSPARWLGIKGHGQTLRPSFEYKKDPRWKVILRPSKIKEAEEV